jgi:putative ABC transport system permease protein
MKFLEFSELAFVHIRHNTLRTWLTMIGIFIGIATIVSLISLGQGLQDAVKAQFTSLGTDRISLQNVQAFSGPPGSMAVRKLTDHDLDLMKSVMGFEVVYGQLLKMEAVTFKDEVRFGYLTSLPKDNRAQSVYYQTARYEAAAGRLLDSRDTGKVLMGYDFASKSIFSRQLRLGDKIKIKDKEFSIVGFLKRTGAPYGENLIIVPEEDLKDALSITDEWSMIIGKVQGGIDTLAVGETLKQKLRRDRKEEKWEEDFTVQTPDDIMKTFSTVLLVVQAVLVGIASISLLVGGIGIMNTMYTSVLERTREIGIMKSIGARNSVILTLFLIESGMLGAVGGFIGMSLGVGFGFIVEVLGQTFYGSKLIQASFPLYLTLGAVSFSFIIGAAAGVLPAIQASRLNPVEALRYRK